MSGQRRWGLALAVMLSGCTLGSCGDAGVGVTPACVAAPELCDDGNACTSDTCDPDGGCVHAEVSCDDGDACVVDGCDPVAGCTHHPATCDDGDACTTDGCDSATGCTHGTASCDDGDPCTNDGCDSLAGCVHTASPDCDGPPCTDDADCDDGDPCSVDSCDLDTGCANTPVSCPDGQTCEGGACVSPPPCLDDADCDDGDPCSVDTCDPDTGCASTPASCPDGQTCEGGACVSPPPCLDDADCDDGDPCSVDTCHPDTGCAHVPVDCSDGDPCTHDSCDPDTGACTAVTVPCECAVDNGGCDPLATCAGADGAVSCTCPPQLFDAHGDGTACWPLAVAGFVTPDDEDGCSGDTLEHDDWYDCDRDPGNAACDPAGSKTYHDSCDYDVAGPLAACRCTYGDGIDHAWVTTVTGPAGCPVVRCGFTVCQGGTAEPEACAADGAPPAPVIEDGWDWSLPAWVEPSPHSGFASTALKHELIDARTVDFSWRQLKPAPDVFDTTSPGEAQGESFESWDEQLASGDPFWMRIWATGAEWAPEWVQEDCGVGPVMDDSGGNPHLPIWNPCVWGHLVDLYREVFVEHGLRADPRFQFAYIPGGFKWCEFDLNLLEEPLESGELTAEMFDTWFHTAMADLVWVLDGENDDPDDDYAYKLVFTGEDFPYGPLKTEADYFARDAVLAGTGIRNGIPENYNHHLNHAPAYGSLIAEDGHLVVDDDWVLFDGKRAVGMENECFASCGVPSQSDEELAYTVRMTNLKSLQLRSTWIYVSSSKSFLDEFADLWTWVHRSLGKRVHDAPDGWALLREWVDNYWIWGEGHDWLTRPWVRNLERWVVQRDVCQGGMTRRGGTYKTDDLFHDDARVYDGRRTDIASGHPHLYFDVADGWIHDQLAPADLKVTFLDTGDAEWWVEYAADGCRRATATVAGPGTGGLRTATFTLPDARFDGSLPGDTDFRITSGGPGDVDVWFVRVVLHHPAGCGDGVQAEGEGCDDGNLQSGDGCTDGCQLEPGWTCPGGVCTCDTGWGGPGCQTPSCAPACQNGGVCVAPDTCECPWNAYGPSCASVYTPQSCLDVLEAGNAAGDGLYTIDPDGDDGPQAPLEVTCEMTTDGGGWTIVFASLDEQPGEPMGSAAGYGADPLTEPYQLPIGVLQLVPQTEHVILRRAPGSSPQSWLRVGCPFFAADQWPADPPGWTKTTATITSASGETATAEVGFASQEISSGGWYGVAPILENTSSSYKQLNGGCDEHYVYVWKVNAFATHEPLGPGWPFTADCSSSAEAHQGVLVGIR